MSARPEILTTVLAPFSALRLTDGSIRPLPAVQWATDEHPDVSLRYWRTCSARSFPMLRSLAYGLCTLMTVAM
ncbi:MAG: hypothetical protein KDA79_14480, partial [Planctomycetaceae bacterium]|nr:hypothetical protein [Planctomycetaceae bacterium]